MKVFHALFVLVTLFTTLHALSIPTSWLDLPSSPNDLFKRKGGGGGGRGGGGGGSSSGSGSGSSGSSGGSSSGSGSSGSSGSGSRGGSGSTSSSSSRGGQSSGGSGTKPSYGGGSYYGGGASVPYTAGARTSSGISPYLIGGASLGLIFPGLWLYGAYAYAYPHPYTYHNDTTNSNDTRPVQCVCQEYQECGCDDNNNTGYINSVANDPSVAKVSNVNGTDTLVINGSLPNGTTAAGAAPGSLKLSLTESSGWWVVVAGVVYTVWFM